MNVAASQPDTLRPALERLQRGALVAGAAGLIDAGAGAAGDADQFFRSYLIGYLLWAGVALGSLGLVMLHHLTGGGWGRAIRSLLESGTRTLPLVALLAVPLLLGLPKLYIWARPEAMAADELLRHKAAYLNVPFFIARLAGYFAIWLGLTFVMNRRGDDAPRKTASGPGLVLFVLTVTFAAIDLAMSLEPAWFSTIYGAILMVGHVLSTLAFVTWMILTLLRHKPYAGAVNAQHFHDLGNLMLAFVMLWAYMSFSQYLIIWAGNLPEEIPWFIARLNGGWEYVAGALLVFHFFVPFFLLLMRFNKRKAEILGRIASFMLLMRLVDLVWMVEPAFHPGRLHLHWMDLALPVGLGGIWMAVFVWQLKRRKVVVEGVEA